jgi:hypothetical protein
MGTLLLTTVVSQRYKEMYPLRGDVLAARLALPKGEPRSSLILLDFDEGLFF